MNSRKPLYYEEEYSLIQSVDTYVYNEFKTKMDAILKDERIVDNTLARLDKDARRNFKEAFTGSEPDKKVEVSYSFPQTKEKFDARIVVQMGTADVISNSVGNVEGTFTYRELGKRKERTVIEEKDNNHLHIPLELDIGELVGIEEITFSVNDNARENGKSIVFNRSGNEELIGTPLTVHYIAKEVQENGEDPKGVKVGFTSREHVVITPVTLNMDTARCLDALIKVVLITMLENDREKDEFLIQDHKFDEMQNIIPDDGLDRLIFGRPLTLSYDVANNLDFDYINDIKEINIEY